MGATDTRELLRWLPVLGGQNREFDVSSAPGEPSELFLRWLTEAIDADLAEPHSMTLSTVDERGWPSARVLILKHVSAEGWQFAVSASSPKGKHLVNTPAAALTFYWKELGRQVRVRGPVFAAASADSARDYLARPTGSRANALVDRQSEPLADVAELRRARTRALARLEQDPEFVYSQWTLYTVHAEEVEFWQADSDRQHIRLRYRFSSDGGWFQERLYP